MWTKFFLLGTFCSWLAVHAATTTTTTPATVTSVPNDVTTTQFSTTTTAAAAAATATTTTQDNNVTNTVTSATNTNNMADTTTSNGSNSSNSSSNSSSSSGSSGANASSMTESTVTSNQTVTSATTSASAASTTDMPASANTTESNVTNTVASTTDTNTTTSNTTTSNSISNTLSSGAGSNSSSSNSSGAISISNSISNSNSSSGSSNSSISGASTGSSSNSSGASSNSNSSSSSSSNSTGSGSGSLSGSASSSSNVTAAPGTGNQTVTSVTTSGTANASASATSTAVIDSCDLSGAQQCLVVMVNEFHEMVSISDYLPNFADLMPWACQKYVDCQPAMLASLQTCPSDRRLDYDAIMAGADFLCDPAGHSVAVAALPCYKNSNSTEGLQMCASLAEVALGMPGRNLCGTTRSYVDCVKTVYEMMCSVEAGQAIRSILTKATEPLHQYLRCPAVPLPPPTTLTLTTTRLPRSVPTTFLPSLAALSPATTQSPIVTTTPAFALKCYQCTTGDPSGPGYDPMCDVDAPANIDYLPLTPCPQPCFAKLNEQTGVVTRGCATGLQHLFPQGVPTGPCLPLGEEVWCFCTTHGCNMGPQMDIEVP